MNSILVDEVRLQLEHDILEYGWLLQIARDCGTVPDVIPITTAVYDAITVLLEEGIAEIGDVHESDDHVRFVPWAESPEDRKLRLRQIVDKIGSSPAPGEGFWLRKRTRREKRCQEPFQHFGGRPDGPC